MDGRIKILLGNGAGRRKTVSALMIDESFLEIGPPPEQPSVYSEGNLKPSSLSKRLVETRAFPFSNLIPN
jgi:hypothetical protein